MVEIVIGLVEFVLGALTNMVLGVVVLLGYMFVTGMIPVLGLWLCASISRRLGISSLANMLDPSGDPKWGRTDGSDSGVREEQDRPDSTMPPPGRA